MLLAGASWTEQSCTESHCADALIPSCVGMWFNAAGRRADSADVVSEDESEEDLETLLLQQTVLNALQPFIQPRGFQLYLINDNDHKKEKRCVV